MVKSVIVFEGDGKINLADMVDWKKEVSRNNLTNILPCPKKWLDCVPKQIVGLCLAMSPQYLYVNKRGNWESISE